MAFRDSKDNHLFMNEYDITSFTTEARPVLSSPLRDVTVFGDGGFKGLRGTGEDKLSWAGLFDDGASGSDVIMHAMRLGSSAKVITVWQNDDVIERECYGSGFAWAETALVEGRIGDVVRMSGEFQLGLADRLKSLGTKVTFSATGNGTSIDDSAASSSGGKWVYHVFAISASGGNARWQLVLQDSANNSTFATVGSESVNLTAVGAARREFTGTFRRYVRIRHVLDATSGSITYLAAYERD